MCVLQNPRIKSHEGECNFEGRRWCNTAVAVSNLMQNLNSRFVHYNGANCFGLDLSDCAQAGYKGQSNSVFFHDGVFHIKTYGGLYLCCTQVFKITTKVMSFAK